MSELDRPGADLENQAAHLHEAALGHSQRERGRATHLRALAHLPHQAGLALGDEPGPEVGARRARCWVLHGGETLVYLWAPTGADTVEARALFTQGPAAVEDPATGSACANLGAWLVAQGQTDLVWQVSQGAQAGRPSTLTLTATESGLVQVGGLVREIGAGAVEL